MIDYFALFDEPRRPWLDAGNLKEKFLALSGGLHPDRQHSAPEAERLAATRRFSELNAAYNCLRDPKDRIRHLLELERGPKPGRIESVPPELMDYFAEVGGVCRNVDAFLAEKAKAPSAILKAQFFQRGLEWSDKINALLAKINDSTLALNTELRQMNSSWAPVKDLKDLPLDRLEDIHRLLVYFGRWTSQLQQRNARLML